MQAKHQLVIVEIALVIAQLHFKNNLFCHSFPLLKDVALLNYRACITIEVLNRNWVIYGDSICNKVFDVKRIHNNFHLLFSYKVL